MATKMPRAVVDLDEFTEPMNIMIYGDTGAGKTELVAHLPGKVLILSSENGTSVIKRSLARLGLNAKKEIKRFKVWPIRAWADLEEAYIWCRDNQDAFDWIVIDSATSLDQRAMRAALEAAVKRNPEKRDIDLPDRGEHQKMQNSMKRMITDFNELSTNTLWLAQAMHREDRDGNEIVVPFIRGKDYEVSAFACAQMQAFGYYLKKKSKGKSGGTDRVLLWESFADKDSGINYWSKDRYDVFPKICVMASGSEQKMMFGDLLALVDGKALASAKDKVETYDDPGEPDEDEAEVADDEQAERRAELMRLGDTPKELAKVMKGLDLNPKDYKGVSIEDIVDDIMAAEFPDDVDEDDDVDGDADAEPDGDDDDEPDDDDDMAERRAELMALTPAQLKKAVVAAGMTVEEFKGQKREDIVEAILAAEADSDADDDADEDEDEDLDLEGMMDEDEDEDEAESAPKAKKAAKKAVGKSNGKKRFRATDDEE